MTRSSTLFFMVIAAIAVVSVVSVCLWFFVRHHKSVSSTPQLAEAEFIRLRTQFSDQKPLLDMDLQELPTKSSSPRALNPLHAVNTVVFDTRGGQRLIHISVPYWLARLFAGRSGEFHWLGELTFFDDTEFDPEAIHLTLDQLERHGPGLVAYYRHAGGGQFIAWVE